MKSLAGRVCFALFFLMPLTVLAQATGTVRGRVRDAATGAPLAQVQVRVDGYSARAQTGPDGSYVLAGVAAGMRQITVRRVGYAPERAQVTVGAGGSATQDFALRVAAVTLGEVVVTGVAAPTTRRQLGNTVETVAGENIRDAPGVTAIDQALQGKITGAVISENSGQPGGGVSVRLRGTNSILGGAEPLYVVDGVIVDNSSDALVGLGSNATRQNSALSNRMADIDPADVERIEVLKGAAAAALYGSRANNGVIQIFTRRGESGQARVTFGTDVTTAWTPKEYDLNMSPNAGLADVAFGGAAALGAPVTRYDIQDQIFRTAASSNTKLAVSGGNEGTTYYVGGGYQKEQGILRSTDYLRRNVRANLSQTVGRDLELAVRGNYIQSLAHFMPEGEQTQGVLTSLVFTPTTVNPNFDGNLGRFPYNPILGANPLDVIANWDAPEKITRLLGGFEANYRPRSDVTITYLTGVDDYRREVTYYQPPQSTGTAFTGSVQNPVQFSRLFNNDLTASHAWSASDALLLNSSVGFRYTSDKSETVRAATGDLAPGQTLIGGAPASPSASQSRTELRTTSWYIEERVGFNDRLFLTGGLNWNSSSAFGTDQRTQMFPRLGLSYVIDQEPFFDRMSVGVLSSLRLRAAWGQTGGQPPGLYSVFENYANTAYAGRPGLVASTTAGNPALKPERQREIEGGFDAGFLNDRAQVEFTVYDKKTTDLVLSVPLQPSSGFAQQFRNIGALSNKGVEVALNIVNFSRPSFTWRSRFTYAANRNKITNLVPGADTTVFEAYLNSVIINQPIGVFYGGAYARNANGTRFYKDTTVTILGVSRTLLLPRRQQDTLANGTVVFARRILGDPNPDFTATFGNDFDIGRSLRLSILLDGRFGNEVANFTRRIQDQFGATKITEREISGDTVMASISQSRYGRTLIYEEFIEDGTYIKLREIALQYALPATFASRLRARSGSLRIAGRNLVTWTDYTGLDPEVNMFSASTVSRGLDFATVPIPRQFSVGITLGY